jgi:hypothetical protein
MARLKGMTMTDNKVRYLATIEIPADMLNWVLEHLRAAEIKTITITLVGDDDDDGEASEALAA